MKYPKLINKKTIYYLILCKKIASLIPNGGRYNYHKLSRGGMDGLTK